MYTVQCRQNCTKLINQFLVGILSVSDVTSSLYLKNCGDCCEVTTSTNMFRYRLHVCNEGLWCRGKYQLDSNITGYYERFLRQIGIGEADPGPCSVPGISKNFLWLLIMLITSVGTFVTRFNASNIIC